MINDFTTTRRKVRAAVEAALAEEARARGKEKLLDGDLARSASAAVVGEGSVVDDALREALSEEPPLALVAFDADRIQGWVFDTSRPAVVGGASHLLDDLGQGLQDLATVGAASWGGVVYSGGGTGLALVAASRAEKLREAIATHCGERCRGLTMTTASLAVWTGDLVDGARKDLTVEGFGARLNECGGLTATLARLHGSLRDAKDARMPAQEALLPAPDKGRGATEREGRCQSCNVRKATTEVQRPEKRTLPVCPICKVRWDAWNRQVHSDKARGLSFTDIAAHSDSSRKYLGVLIADGNSMGRTFQQVGRLDKLAALSGEVSRIYQAARDRCMAELSLKDKEGNAHALSLLSGGDEVVLILPGDRGLRAARLVLRTIHEEVGRSTKDGVLAEAFGDEPKLLATLKNMSAGAGLIVSGPKLPIRHLIELAQGLERTAKAASGRKESAVDFEVLTGGSMLPVSVERLRKLHETAGDLRRTAKPYTFGRLEELLADLDHSREVPRSQLYNLRGGLAEGRRAFLNHALYQFARNVPLYQWGRRHGWKDPADFEGWLVRKEGDLWTTWVKDLLEIRELDWTVEGR